MDHRPDWFNILILFNYIIKKIKKKVIMMIYKKNLIKLKDLITSIYN